MSKDLNEQILKRKKQLNEFKIDNVIKTDDFILIESHMHCKMWFAFYKHFIVCSGDFGEWVFNCTWQTVVNKTPTYSSDVYYLASKISSENKKYIFDNLQVEKDIDEWFENYKENNDYFEDLNQEIKEEVFELIEDLKNKVDDEHRRAYYIDEFRKDFEDLTSYQFDDDYELYEVGKDYHPYLIMNLGCLLKIKEIWKDLEELKNVESER